MQVEHLQKYFPEWNEQQKAHYEALFDLYAHWNAQINVISRKDMEHFYLHHVLHSLAITRTVDFSTSQRVIDIGTGGGFPGLPLAILYPETEFVLVDSIGKKIKVVNAVKEALGLKNVVAIHSRAEDLKITTSMMVSRAVTRLQPFLEFTKHLWNRKGMENPHDGLYYLKGGDLMEELAETGIMPEVHWINAFFEESFFETKAVVFLPKSKLIRQ